MELSIEQYFGMLADRWEIQEERLLAYWGELNADRRFIDSINVSIYDVPNFSGVYFESVSRMHVYRCLLYLLTRVLRPEIFVETGVQNGMSSAFILQAMEHNGCGALHSIDRPPIQQYILDQGTPALPKDKSPGWIIPSYLRHRHRLVLGAAEVQLPILMAELPRVDVFVHDSDHSYSHVMFEIGLAWHYLTEGGCILVDNIEQSAAFSDFARGVGAPSFVVSSFDGPDRVWQHGILSKPAHQAQ